jgi:hypothetical protein
VSTLRRTFKVSWADGELVEVTTNARDMAAAQEYANDPAMGTFALIHHALRRTGHTVPKLDKFVDLLDEMLPADDEEAELEPLPTSLEASGRGLLPLRSSQEQTPESGSMTTEPSSVQNAS